MSNQHFTFLPVWTVSSATAQISWLLVMMYNIRNTCSLTDRVNSVIVSKCRYKSEFLAVCPPPTLRGWTQKHHTVFQQSLGPSRLVKPNPKNKARSGARTHHLNAGRCSPEKCSAVPQALSFPRASCCGRAELVSVRVGGGVSAARSSVLTLALSRTDGEAHCNRALWLLGAHWATAAALHPAACPERQDACVSAVWGSVLKIMMHCMTRSTLVE